MTVIEPVSDDDPGEARRGRARVRLTVDYIRERRRPVAIVLLAAAVVGTSVALLLPAKYTARASFYSEGKQGSGDLSSLSSLGPKCRWSGTSAPAMCRSRSPPMS